MEKQELMIRLKELLPVMDMVEQYNEKLDGIWREKESLKSQINETFRFKDNMSWPVKTGVTILCLLYWTISSKIVATLYVGAIVALVLWLRIRVKSMFEQNKESLRQELARVEQIYEQTDQEMIENFAPYWQKMQEVIPKDYMAPIFVKTVYTYLENGRADTMKEAINLFEEEQHRWRMEQNQQQMYEQYQAELQNLRETTKELEQRIGAAENDAYAARAYAMRGC